MKTNSSYDSDSDDDLVVVTPLDEVLSHKPTEHKFDILSGMVPFVVNVSCKLIIF